jgi:tRNA(Ile)-lysidine synthase
VSGGADSTALLLGLHRLRDEFGVSLHAAHLNHGLRGAAADGDFAYVSALCDQLGVPLSAARWNTGARMARRGLSGQAGLRTLRREFLTAAARSARAVAIATAHTADDQLETVLMRLARGAGLTGLGAMSARRGRWVRPLLDATRADIEADLRGTGVAWREDASNADPNYARSRVRHEVIPALISILRPGLAGRSGPEARAGLARRVSESARELRQARRVLERQAARVLSRLSRIQAGEFVLDSVGLRSYPTALRRMVLRRLWARLEGSRVGLVQAQLAALERLTGSPRGDSSVELPRGWQARLDRGAVHFTRQRAKSASSARSVRVPERGRWSAGRIRGGWLSGGVARARLSIKPQSVEYFAAESLEGAVEFRSARPDEPFVPFGDRRPRLLGEFLSKQPVSRALRAHPVVLADAQGILWVVGVRRAARAPVTADTRRALWVHAESHD